MQLPSTYTWAPWAWQLLPIQAVKVRYNPRDAAAVSALLSGVIFFPSANFSEQKSLSFPRAHALNSSKPAPSACWWWCFLDGEGKKLDQKISGVLGSWSRVGEAGGLEPVSWKIAVEE